MAIHSSQRPLLLQLLSTISFICSSSLMSSCATFVPLHPFDRSFRVFHFCPLLSCGFFHLLFPPFLLRLIKYVICVLRFFHIFSFLANLPFLRHYSYGFYFLHLFQFSLLLFVPRLQFLFFIYPFFSVNFISFISVIVAIICFCPHF